MISRTIECPPWGTLKAKGRSSNWQGSTTITALGGCFAVRVHGTADGPSPSQHLAFTKLIAQSSVLADEIASKIIAFIQQCQPWPMAQPITKAELWLQLRPELIEIHCDHQYAHGASEHGTHAISIGYLTPWSEDHAIQVPFLNGKIGTLYCE